MQMPFWTIKKINMKRKNIDFTNELNEWEQKGSPHSTQDVGFNHISINILVEIYYSLWCHYTPSQSQMYT